MPEHMRLPLTHMTGLLITLLALAVAWIVAVGLAPAASAVSSLSDAGQMAYTYDAPRLSTEYNDAVSQRGPPPVACDYTTHPLPVEVASYGPSPRQSPPSARTYDDYDRSVQLTHGDNARATTRTVTACRDGNVRLVAGASVAANAGDDLTRVGRWMSQSEYDQMVKSSRVIEGGGGRTYVVRPPNPETYKPGKGVYAEFDVPTSSLHPAGGNPNYAVIPGPNAGTTRFGPLPTQMPRATCIELVCRR